MDYLLNILSIFWFVRTIKFVLFWVYLWQLKEYHIGRFKDHFTTHKGKKIFLNPFFILKLFLLLLLLLSYYFFDIVFYALLLVYLLESCSFLLSILKRRLKAPVFTFKTSLLTVVSFLVFISLFMLAYVQTFTDFWFVFLILAIDILTPLIVSIIVFLFHPIFVMGRNNIIRKATEKIKKFDKLVVIGITGSYGKTSTKEFLTTILSEKFNVLSTKEHRNSEIGISKTILEELNKDHQIFIVEMGAYRKGGITLLCDIVRPVIGMVTGVNEQHMATFGSMENILSAEGGQELLESLPKNGMIVLNGDNKYCVDLYKKANIHKRIYSEEGSKIDSDIWSEEVFVDKKSLDFIAITKKKEAEHFNVKVLGRQNIQNLLGAILIARELGMSFGEISKAANNIKEEQGGMTIKTGIHGITIVDSSYSSNPDGVVADLDYLNILEGKKIIVMPCLIELGKKSKEIHYKIGQKISEIADMAIITTKERFQDIKDGAKENNMEENKIILAEKPNEILHSITTFCKSGDAVLLEGRIPSQLIRLLINDKND